MMMIDDPEAVEEYLNGEYLDELRRAAQAAAHRKNHVNLIPDNIVLGDE